VSDRVSVATTKNEAESTGATIRFCGWPMISGGAVVAVSVWVEEEL
jgi:hypothetical protein